jgi:hypothetical protein
VQQLLQD